ncbi:MAG: metallophosphoesterase [Bradymonadaceae bacterium]|nr:metallophosphoesterase [Lujinxingiaceae bacterium]
MLARRAMEPGLVFDLLQWVTYIGMGAFCLLFVLMVIKDLGWLSYLATRRATQKARSARARQGGELADPARRAFMTNTLNASVVTAAAVGTKYGFYEARKLPAIVEVQIPIDGLDPRLDGFRIVQLSDIHVGPTIRGEMVRAIVEASNALAPDLIAITGDLVDGLVPSLWPEVAPIADLRARHGVFFATGNHEYYWDALAWCKKLEANGLYVLNNAHRLIEHNGAGLLIAGCTDYSAGGHIKEHASDPQAAIAGAPEHNVSILMAHQPRSIFAAVRAGFDLQISGHTHGGQFWPWNHVVGLVHPFSVGLDRLEKTWIYVSRGTGYWGPPMRIGAPSEITRITLKRAG